jgi:UTP-glucose-1-phosphate uridylyltransferase
MNEQIVLQKNNRIRNCMEDEDEISENDFDEDVNLENNLKQENKNTMNVRSQGNIRKTFSKKKGLI